MTILDRPLLTTLSTRTVSVSSPGALLDLLPESSPLAWVRAGEGIVGWGAAASVRLTGPDQVAQARAWWSDLCASAEVADDVQVPGSGLVCFGSFAFDPHAAESVLVVPSTVVGHRDGTWFVTTVASDGRAATAGSGPAPGDDVAPAPDLRPLPAVAPGRVRYDERGTSRRNYASLVEEAVRRIRRGDVAKVVLARDVLALSERPLDLRWPLRRLAERNPDAWTFTVDGLFGATPELLVRLADGVVTSRVLAGTVSRGDGSGAGTAGTDEAADTAGALALTASAKEREEHALAVDSVREALAPLCTAMDVPEVPSILALPTLLHLATDVSGVAGDGVAVLDLVEALHPTAAVCGTPTHVARDLLRELERLDRGRYAGPVGWFDARGDGEFGIALRCAQVDPADTRRARLFAGCGIVADSDPTAELAESEAKTGSVRSALED